MFPKFPPGAALAIALGLVLIMPGAESIWVDEAQTWRYARLHSFAEFWTEFKNDKASEAQMPLSMAMAWVFGNFLGTSEWLMRAPNILWTTGSILCFYFIGRREQQPLLPLFLAVQPYVWFYGNEARPYALQIFGGSLLLLALHSVFTRGHAGVGWVATWGIGCAVACGSSMLGVIPAGCVSLIILIRLAKNRFCPEKRQLVVFAAFFLPLLVLGFYYATTLLKGAGGAKIWQVGPQNLVFSAVEFLGLAGFLPPRQLLREIARGNAPLPWDSPLFVASSVGAALIVTLLFFIVFRSLKYWRTAPSTVVASTLVVLGSGLILFCAALFVAFPFWGRHLAACFPFYAIVLFWLLSIFNANKSFLNNVLIVSMLAMLLLSSILLRFSPHHRKDDYRSAAKLAQSYLEQGKTVWWAADEPSLLYYFPDAENHLQSGELFLAFGPRATPLGNRDFPDIVLLSKPDIYDSDGALSRFVLENNIRQSISYQAFSIFKR